MVQLQGRVVDAGAVAKAGGSVLLPVLLVLLMLWAVTKTS
jgi:hypothetical protein